MKKIINIRKHQEENGYNIDESKFKELKPSVKRYAWIDKYEETPDYKKTVGFLEKKTDEINKGIPTENQTKTPDGYVLAGATITTEDDTVYTDDQAVSQLVRRTVAAYGAHENIVSIEDALIKSYKNEDGTVKYILTTLVKGNSKEKQFK